MLTSIAGRTALLATLLLGLSQFSAVDVDLWHEMALFREAVVARSFPQEDVFAYTPTVTPVVHHEWGTGAVLYLLTVTTGWGAGGLVAVRYLLIAAIALGCHACARRKGASDAAFVVPAFLGITLAMPAFVTTIRAQAFTLAFLVCMLLLLEEDQRGRRWWLLAWIPLYLLWLNLHAGFLAGVGLYAIHTAEVFVRALAEQRNLTRALRRVSNLVMGGVAMVVLTGVNPYGYDYAPYLWRAIRMDRPMVGEWQPLWDQDAGYLLPLYVISLLIVAYTWFTRRRGWLTGLPLIAVTAWLAAQHTRHISLYAVVWTCHVPAYLERTWLGRQMRELWTRRSGFLVVWFGALACFASSVAVQQKFWKLDVPARKAETPSEIAYPIGVVEYLARHRFEGNVMTDFDWGAFVMWKLHPAVKISLDSRFEVAYTPELVAEIRRFYSGQQGWRETLGRFPTDAVIVPRGGPIDLLLIEEPSHRWRVVYADDSYRLYVRGDLESALPILDRSGAQLTGAFP